MKTYHSRKWLNPEGDKSWASIQCWHGCGNQDLELEQFRGQPETLVVLQGCHNTVALHMTTPSYEEYVKKLRLLASEVNKFADWIEDNEGELK